MIDKDIEEMNAIGWWHRIPIGDVTTPGHNEESQSTLDAMNLGDLTGKTVLDIGCWDGFYSFACEKKNAKRVVASDRFVWDLPDFTDAGFNFAHKHLNSKVEKLHASVEELPEKNLGKFDIVLMLGVLYHAKSPIQYIEIAKELSKGIVIFETAVDLMDIPVPVARYYVHDELNHDPTNFWGFNELAMLGMMRDAGYKNIKSVRLGNQNRMLFIGEV
jgi:tRNA (mo5U34)-methyltransferase